MKSFSEFLFEEHSVKKHSSPQRIRASGQYFEKCFISDFNNAVFSLIVHKKTLFLTD